MIEIDTRHGEDHDVTRPGLQRLLRGLVMAGRVKAIWLGTPCGSWSIARCGGDGPPPLRDKDHVMGLRDLGPKDQLKVEIGNAVMKLSASMLLLCGRARSVRSRKSPQLKTVVSTSHGSSE